MQVAGISLKLFFSQADDEPDRALYVVLAQAQKASHEVIALQSNGGSLIDLDIDASTRSHRKPEGRCRNAQVALTGVNGAQLDMGKRSNFVKAAICKNGPVRGRLG